MVIKPTPCCGRNVGPRQRRRGCFAPSTTACMFNPARPLPRLSLTCGHASKQAGPRLEGARQVRPLARAVVAAKRGAGHGAKARALQVVLLGAVGRAVQKVRRAKLPSLQQEGLLGARQRSRRLLTATNHRTHPPDPITQTPPTTLRLTASDSLLLSYPELLPLLLLLSLSSSLLLDSSPAAPAATAPSSSSDSSLSLSSSPSESELDSDSSCARTAPEGCPRRQRM